METIVPFQEINSGNQYKSTHCQEKLVISKGDLKLNK